MAEWKEIELGPLADIKGGKRLPKGSMLSEIPNSHPYIRTRDINNNNISINELLFVPDETFPSISRYIVEANDVIISIVGTIGLCAIIPDELHLASLTENCVKIVNVKEDVLDKRYLFYFLTSEDGQAEIESRNVGSTQPKLPLYNIQGIPIPIPPLPEQKAIASVLSSLDDKIDLLHRQNKTLEAMAETLFRQWFVEEAQEDWEEKPLSSIAEHKKINIRPDQNKKTTYRHYSIPAFDDGKHPIKELGSEIKSNKYQVFANSILISKLNPRFPRVWAISDLLAKNSI